MADRARTFVCGRTYDLRANTIRQIDEQTEGTPVSEADDEKVGALLPDGNRTEMLEELELAQIGCKPFDLQGFRESHLSPVLWSSVLRNYGVRNLINLLAEIAPTPCDARFIEPHEPKMTGFVFKIQANMDPHHRDRIAFMRVVSGKLTRGMKARLSRTGKTISLRTPQFFFAQDRSLVEEAYAGDVVGIPNHGTLRIGDTLTEGEKVIFRGVPSFAPEILHHVSLKDAMKAKKMKEALQQLAEEGVVQASTPHDGSPALVGVVGALQLDVLVERMKTEYGLPIAFEPARCEACRWVSSSDHAAFDKFMDKNRSAMAADLDDAPVFMATSAFMLNYEKERNPDIKFTDVKDYQQEMVA